MDSNVTTRGPALLTLRLHAARPPGRQIVIVLHAFLATSVLLPTLSAASNIVQNPANGAPPKGFYEVPPTPAASSSQRPP